MAIHTKVGILTHVPGSSASVTPGLIDGLYADFLTKDLDFMDNPVTYPRYEWFTAGSRANIGTGDWEDLAGTYRQWRDSYNKEQFEYWLTREFRIPFQYKNFTKDPAPWSNNYNGTNATEWIRLVYPAPNGDFNIPYPNPTGSDNYALYNSSRPLLHNRTKFRIPIVEAALSYSNNDVYVIENQEMVRDNQAAIDAKQTEADAKQAEFWVLLDLIRDTLEPQLQILNDYLNQLISDGADQSLIDAKQVEIDAKQAEIDAKQAEKVTNQAEVEVLNNEVSILQNSSNLVAPDTKDSRYSKYRDGRERWYYLIDQMIQRDLTPEETTEMESLEANERVLFATGDIYASMWTDERWATVRPDNRTNHPLGTMPVDVLSGITDINILPAVKNSSLLPHVGNPGDIVQVIGDDFYAWDPQNQEWSLNFYYRFLESIIVPGFQKRDAYLKAKNELELSTRPTQFSGFFIPAFAITVDGAYETLQPDTSGSAILG